MGSQHLVPLPPHSRHHAKSANHMTVVPASSPSAAHMLCIACVCAPRVTGSIPATFGLLFRRLGKIEILSQPDQAEMKLHGAKVSFFSFFLSLVSGDDRAPKNLIQHGVIIRVVFRLGQPQRQKTQVANVH